MSTLTGARPSCDAHERCGVIYMLTAPNGKKYIGQTMNYEWRMQQHMYSTSSAKNWHFAIYRAIRKYGWENFTKKVVWKCKESELNHYEMLLIKQYKTYENGYNMTIGGHGRRGHHHSEKSKLQMRRSHLKRKRFGGVTKRGNSYMARVKIDRKTHHVGSYHSLKCAREACLMYQEDDLLMSTR